MSLNKKFDGNIITTIVEWTGVRINDLFNFAQPLTQQTSSAHGSLFFWLPIMLCVVAIMPLLTISDFSYSTILIGCALSLLVSVFVGWLLRRHHIHTVDRLLVAQKKSISDHTSFYTQIFPVWSRQISTSQSVGDKAVTKLTRLFGDIVSKLEAMLKLSRGGARTGTGHSYEKDFLDVVAGSQADIKSVLMDLKAALEMVNDSKDMLLAEITTYSVKMKDMAVEANLIAFQSQIIALNAEIEAARAGHAGRAFAAVVSEMRQLARQSGETSKRMTKQVETIDSAMFRFYESDKEMAIKEEQQLTSAESMFNSIIERFNKVTTELEASMATMGVESKQIRDDIASALVQFQFQDRVSQIMAHVADNINVLNELTEAGTQNLDADTWLSDMKNKFSVDEEHGNLNDVQTSSIQPSSLTFF